MARIDIRQDGRVLVLTIDRPDKKNALTNTMYGTLADALDAASRDPDVRCVLITGTGDTFTAGNDIGDFAAVAAGGAGQTTFHVHRVLRALATFEKPIVAAVAGPAVGVGMTMLLHCDLVYLADTALLSAPFVDLALVPEAGSSLLLPERIGHLRSFAVFALGEVLDAPTALDWGLASHIVAASALQVQAMKAAQALASRSPGALIATKRLMRDRDAVLARIADETAMFEQRLTSEEAREAFAAFVERRKPDFSSF